MTVHAASLSLEWLGYAGLRIEGADAIVYVDPGRYGTLTGTWHPDSESAANAHPPGRDYRPADGDLVCVTHVHHYDPDGIDRVARDDATLLVFEGLNVHDTDRTDRRPADLGYVSRRVGEAAETVAAGCPVWTMPAYNEPDGDHLRPDGSPVHPRGFGCGFVFVVDGTRVCWPGDTDVLPGHAQLDVDVFCPPIGGSFTMDRRAAAELAAEIDPAIVLPIHYNTFDALEVDSGAFAADVARRGVPVVLDEGDRGTA